MGAVAGVRCISRVPLVLALTCGLLTVEASSGQNEPARHAVAPPRSENARPSPFAFQVEEIRLAFGDKVVLHDTFRNGKLKAIVNLGKLSDANLHDGALRIDQDATTNVWLGPGGTFGHRLHHHDVYVTLLTLPIRGPGGTTFLGAEAFPLEYSVRLHKPRFSGFEKLKIGLLDMESFKSVAAIAVGRLAAPSTAPSSTTQGDGQRITNVRDRPSGPAVALNRVEEPDVVGEIVLDHAGLESFGEIDTFEMLLRVAQDGHLSGLARIHAGGRISELNLEPQAEASQAAYDRRSRVPAHVRLSASMFVETLPMPEVFRVAPSEVPIRDLRSADKVRFRIEGIGFGPDTRVEIVPDGSRSGGIEAGSVQLARKHQGPEGAVLLVDVPMRDAQPANYSLRITTGGQSTTVRNAVRVF